MTWAQVSKMNRSVDTMKSAQVLPMNGAAHRKTRSVPASKMDRSVDTPMTPMTSVVDSDDVKNRCQDQAHLPSPHWPQPLKQSSRASKACSYYSKTASQASQASCCSI